MLTIIGILVSIDRSLLVNAIFGRWNFDDYVNLAKHGLTIGAKHASIQEIPEIPEPISAPENYIGDCFWTIADDLIKLGIRNDDI